MRTRQLDRTRRIWMLAAHFMIADFPLGLPLTANQTSVIPLDLFISFADVPGLAGAIRQAAAGQPVASEMNGTVKWMRDASASRHSGRCC